MKDGKEQRLILASASPRRKALLEQIGISPEVRPARLEETLPPGILPIRAAPDLARRKLQAFRNSYPPEIFRETYVLAADTLLAGEAPPDSRRSTIIGKPRDPVDAEQILRRLRGRNHWVVTGLALLLPEPVPEPGEIPEPVTIHVTTRVTMKNFSEETLRWYLDTGEGLDAAGAYKIQQRGACLVESIQGSFSNVAGLPLETIYDILVSNQFIFRSAE